jgi:hypothetical protein
VDRRADLLPGDDLAGAEAAALAGAQAVAADLAAFLGLA